MTHDTEGAPRDASTVIFSIYRMMDTMFGD
ncbi:hypothetical protein PJL15_00687 [Paenarthrobacter nitroguajacolicus]|nr:hypothetical protein [Paenarthrobacter nitroguajacolicus]